MPIFIIFIADGVKKIRDVTKDRSVFISALFTGILFVYPLSQAVNHIKRPLSLEEARPVLSYIKNKWQDGDIVYVGYYSQHAFNYYAKYRLGFNENEYLTGIAPRLYYNSWNKDQLPEIYRVKGAFVQSDNDILNTFVEDLSRVSGRKRVWVLFIGASTRKNGMRDENFYLFILDNIGKRIDSFRYAGKSSVYLYDLSGDK
ncbi:MAG: hypothetical protein HY758_06910 [Nitrospirae bacterium]|nr:hypothetical protein [Nitrospirota bacterium]